MDNLNNNSSTYILLNKGKRINEEKRQSDQRKRVKKGERIEGNQQWQKWM